MNIPRPADGIAWVTGASSGIGGEVAAQLAAAGWTVAISARRAEALESLAAAHPGKMIVAPLDITDTAAAAAAVQAIESKAGRPIVRAILNAGSYLRDTGTDFDVERFKAQVDVNLVGTANCLAPLLPLMLARRHGQIGLVASLTALGGLPGAVTYSATKAALLSIGQSLNFDCRKAGVGMSVILPGFVKTPATDVNSYPMPFLMEVDAAARTILRGLDSGRFFIAFPGGLGWPLRFLRLLPSSLYFALVARATKW